MVIMRIKEQFEIEPNSNTALYTSLTGLNTDQMMHIVLSNGFVPEHVRYNTIIWDNWDIFSQCRYIWTVVRKQPSLVKLWTTSNVCFVCFPSSKEKGMYEVKYLKPLAKKCMRLSEIPCVEKFKWPVSLKEAVERTEKYLCFNSSKGCGYEVPRRNGGFSEYDEYDFDNEEDIEIAFQKHYLQSFQRAGVDKVSMQQLIRQQDAHILDAALETLTQDIEPDENTLKVILGDYKHSYLFTKRELEKLLKFREGLQQKQYNEEWLMQYNIEVRREAKTVKE